MGNNKVDIHKKLKTANENIYALSERVVELIRQRNKNCCCDYKKMINGCDSNCEKCQDEYHKKMLEDIYNDMKVE